MTHSIFKNYPEKDAILEWYSMNGSNIIYHVNNHFHTPYSFSAFTSINQIFELAKKEKVSVLGINDLNTFSGFEEFNELCLEYRLFPCFNIEFTGLIRSAQKAGITINDPVHPGRIYVSGKGLDYPVNSTGNSAKKINTLISESAGQAELMLELVSKHLKSIDADLELNKDYIYGKYTLGTLRVGHIARAVREAILKKYPNEEARNTILVRIYGGNESKVNFNNHAAAESEITTQLFSSGGIANLKEDLKAILELDDIVKIILDSGGIPTYKVLLDYEEGNYSEFEKDIEQLHKELSSKNIYSLELIPARNDFVRVREFVRFFHNRNYIVSFGTGHNTSNMIPLRVSSKDGVVLDEYLRRVAFEAACVIAANQYYRAKSQDGYVEKNGRFRLALKDEFIETGNAVIEYFMQTNTQ
ncbi:MAG: PHP domain-containing protein [Bacteroidales bacterium]|nr:PHP domain-containing protein [Bacteroidales bacterium]MCF8391830.1 PHP domain-containing protein [Bacteroidales bacterium]